MGEKGLPSRILAPKFGGYLTFGALSPSKSSAPGQPTVSDLRKLYRLQDQSAATQVNPHNSCQGIQLDPTSPISLQGSFTCSLRSPVQRLKWLLMPPFAYC